MSAVVYAIRISHLEYSGLKVMDIKIGKSTDIENTLRQYSRGNRDIELLDMWTPNPDKTLSTAERGVHAVAERYAYDKQSEKFVFFKARTRSSPRRSTCSSRTSVARISPRSRRRASPTTSTTTPARRPR